MPSNDRNVDDNKDGCGTRDDVAAADNNDKTNKKSK